jgi:hypothetical protein
MKVTSLLFLSILGIHAHGAIIAQWNFNSPTPDASSGTGTTSPSMGSGSISTVGGATTTGFNAGGTGTVGPASSSDPNNSDDSGYQTTTYPALGTANKTAGVQVAVSTVGYSGISFSWDTRYSNTSANTQRFQYTLDITQTIPTWVDSTQFTFTPAASGTGDAWYNGRTVDLTSVTGADNNANFAFRLVAEFDPVTGNYLASRSTSSYGPASTWRFDMITVNGSAVPEPSSMLLGLLSLPLILRRKRLA